MSVRKPVVRHAALTDVGRRHLGNEDAAYCAEPMGMFVISDGMGGLPAGGAASRVIVSAMPPLIQRGLDRLPPNPGIDLIHALLKRATRTLSEHMYAKSRICTGLAGWGATLVLLYLRDRNAHLLNVGDSRGYLLRDRKLSQITSDDSIVNRMLEAGKIITADFERKNRNLVSQHVAMQSNITPQVHTMALKEGDRILLCTDGLCGPVSDADVERIMCSESDPMKVCRQLIESANAAGGPDNITALVVDWQDCEDRADEGVYSLEPPDALLPVQLPREAGRMHEVLLRLEQDLRWLHEGAHELAHCKPVDAPAIARRLIGKGTFENLASADDADHPARAFHQICISPDWHWRRNYDRYLEAIDPVMQALNSGKVVLSPLLTNEDAAMILRVLWNEFRRVEQLYFSIAQRNPLANKPRSLALLTKHMVENVRTLLGLIQFLPTFVC